MRSIISITVFVAIAICLFASLPHVFGASSQDASSALANAKQALQTAFVNVLEAEKSGVNVSVLIYQLNEAGGSLTSAETAFSNSDYSETVNLADVSETLANGVSTDAAAMKIQAPDWFSSSLTTLAVSFLASGVFIAILTLTWLSFKRYYLRRMSKSRPKVIDYADFE